MLRLMFSLVTVIVCCEGQSSVKTCKCNDNSDSSDICFCVRSYQCASGQVVTDGRGIINIRADSFSARRCQGPTSDEELFCCKTNGTQPRSPDIIDFITTQVPPLPTVKPNKKPISCGVQKTRIQARVLTDDITPIDGEFPWIAAIYRSDYEGDEFRYRCAGSLVHPRVVLTVNHYFRSFDHTHFKVILNGKIELPTVGKRIEDERNVQEIVHHPKYYSGGLYNNAALLILDKPYVLTGAINKVCLPPKNANLENRTCSLAGWGRGSEVDGHTVLKKVDLPVIPHTECQSRLRESPYLSKEFVLDDSQMCAGGEEGKDACDGDGGAPLVCFVPSEDMYFQVGIVSFGAKCGESGVPGVYTDVTALRPWIEEELKKRNLNFN
ncbi:unnamed protein product [Acanthoscelides obtectus]|uniref:Peptidase S1 domain-containing protein n=1 Tax=Acanthoscelides obtectus TaxID=200917 RepID=A0A9P0Q7B6_ACAOB|nr:unnamed protein product [Acanthoscelides obtectus]CAK1645033.1 Phenoloxidase-activating factor 2 [Acanthoscelides obtectus]